ncbi:MAG: right-handed parallel beta-helix repeat-containing protein, partial [Candidatus Cloacimonetes bacterium]|nr:right-handed parallel beta-helix repeat-containing protein [Candidatus Cloacimonadota bacterium]
VVKCPYTYVYNNTVSNCNYYGIDGTGDWDYAAIHVQDYPNYGDTPSHHCIIDDNTVYDCINGIQIWSADCQVTNNEIYNMGLSYADTKVVGTRTYKNSAILIGTNFGNPTSEHDPTGVVIENNNIYDNYWGLFYSADLTNGVTAEENWWGDASGPSGAGPGTGDAVSANVDYSPWLGATPGTSPMTWYTNDSIQDAIDAASAGDVINVEDGTYTITSAIDVNKGVTITGNTTTPANVVVKYVPASTTLDLDGFDIGAANITIQGFKIIDCFRGVHFGRTDVTSTGCTITNCVFDNNSENAIGEVAAENTTISNNTVTDCNMGIEIRANEATSLANRTDVTGNTISSCSQSCIQTFKGKFVYIYNNTITSTGDKGINIIGSSATSSDERIQVVGNNISGTVADGIQLSSSGSSYPRYVYVHGNTISDTHAPGISVRNVQAAGTADRVEVSGNTISGTYFEGITVQYSSPYTYVYNNTLTGCNYHGDDGTGDWDYASIHVEDTDGFGGSHHTVIDNNTISDGINGIQIWSDDCTVTNNTIYDMGLTYDDTKVTGDGTYYNSGIIIGSNLLTGNNKPTGTTITGNDIHGNYHGLYVRDYATLSPDDPSVLSVTAEKNYWGSAKGPDDPNNTPALNPYYTILGSCGNPVSKYVDFIPWYATDTTTPSTEYATLKSDDGLGDALYTVFTSDELTNALANCVDGDEVVLGSATFTGDFTVSDDITITAASGAVPVIQGTVTIDNDSVTLDGLTIDADTGDPAVVIGSGVDGSTVAINNGSILADGGSGAEAIDNNSGEDINIENNWWGSDSPVWADLLVDQSTPTNYSSAAPISIYVSATESLIKDVEEQTYSVIANAVEDLYAFEVQLKFLKADFDAPDWGTKFVLGPLFTGNTYFNYDDDSDVTYYKYTVTGGFIGAVNGVTGSDVVLFTADLTSKTDSENLPGSPISLPNGKVVLKDHLNANITCSGTTGKVITIDSSEPYMSAITETPNQTIPIDHPASAAVDYARVQATNLGLAFYDNYNLDYIRYKIQLQSAADPTAIADFSSDVQTGISGTLWNNGGIDWPIPDGVLNNAVNDLPTGDYDIFFLAVDDAGNFDIPSGWKFKIDKTAPGPITWEVGDFCRPTADANNSIDLDWTNPASDVDKIHIWALDYATLTNANAYPEYNPSTFTPPTPSPAWPDPYLDETGTDSDWTLITNTDTGEDYTYTGMSRGYYYFVIYVEDVAGNMSTHPASYKASVSYWPGDVDADPGDVDAADIALLSAVWGLEHGETGWNNVIDVGPTTDYGRHSRPTPDDDIDIEDLMIFAMNYLNTDYTVYTRDDIPDPVPIQIELEYEQIENQIIAELILGENTGFVKGLNIPVSYGSGLALESVQSGTIWPEGSFFIHTNNDNVVELSGSVLGSDSCIEENGVIATIVFQVTGQATSMELQQMTARSFDNQEIEIIDNPELTSEDPDPVIPIKNILGINYPNPFNPITTIEFGLKKEGKVRIVMYNIRGQKVKTLVNDIMPEGYHQVIWNGKNENNRPVSSGVYFYMMEAENYTKVRKAILLK